jgi:hypothetical protein
MARVKSRNSRAGLLLRAYPTPFIFRRVEGTCEFVHKLRPRRREENQDAASLRWLSPFPKSR